MLRNACVVVALTVLTACGDSNSESPGTAGAAAGVPTATSASLSGEDAPEADNGWATEERKSPVQGSQYIAQFSAGDGSTTDPFRQIEITCVARTKALNVTLLVQTTPPTESQFSSFTAPGGAVLFGVPAQQLTFPKGSMVSARNQTPVAAADFFQIVEFNNQASLRLDTGNNTNAAGNFLAELPMAVEMQSNVGTVLFEIPRSEAVLGVLANCAPDPSLKVARDAAQAEYEAARASVSALEKQLQAEVDALQTVVYAKNDAKYNASLELGRHPEITYGGRDLVKEAAHADAKQALEAAEVERIAAQEALDTAKQNMTARVDEAAARATAAREAYVALPSQ
jgi:hypothetical protein